MSHHRPLLVAVAVLAITRAAAAAPQAHTCYLSDLDQQTFSPVALPPFEVPLEVLDGKSISVTIDPDTGAFTFDGSAVPPLHFRNGFSDAWDVMFFPTEPVAGTIDSSGVVNLPAVQYRVCTFGTCPGGGGDCDCVPSNLCSNDTSQICLPSATSGELACAGGGVCQGVCSDDLTKTCAGDDDCLPAGFCGTGSLLRLTPDLTSGTAALDDLLMTGWRESVFTDGRIELVDLFRTSIETPVIGDTGITSVTLECHLDPTPAPSTLAPASSWTVKKGTVKLGKDEAGAGDDKITVNGIFMPEGGTADFAAEDLTLTFTSPFSENVLLASQIPAGSMKANKNGTKFSLKDKTGEIVNVTPLQPTTTERAFTVKVKKKKSGEHQITFFGKNLNLDGFLLDELTSIVIYATQTPSQTVPAVGKSYKVVFPREHSGGPPNSD